MPTDLSALPDWLALVGQTLEPGPRAKLARQIGQMLRTANAERISANVEPDGGAMAPRKPLTVRAKADAKAGRIKTRAKMFPRLKLQKHLRVRADADGAHVGFFGGNPRRTAAEHHFGLVGFVAKDSNGNTIRTRYTARRLLGFGAGDGDKIMDAAISHVAQTA